MIAISFNNEKHLSHLLLAAVLAAFLFSACAPYQARRHPLDYLATGEASWYGPGFHGRKTANGEKYNQRALTAAHQTLPLGTSVRVTNLENDKSVVVRINDRGPFVGGRIIDLSKGAAEKIGMLGGGTAEVRIDAISAPVEKTDATVALASKRAKSGHRALSDGGEGAGDDPDSGDVSTDRSGVAALIAREPKDGKEEYAGDDVKPSRSRMKKSSKPAAMENIPETPAVNEEF